MNGEPNLRTRSKALARLQAQGYKVEKSKLYADARLGRLPLQADGSIRTDDLQAYAERFLDKQKAWSETGDILDMLGRVMDLLFVVQRRLKLSLRKN